MIRTLLSKCQGDERQRSSVDEEALALLGHRVQRQRQLRAHPICRLWQTDSTLARGPRATVAVAVAPAAPLITPVLL